MSHITIIRGESSEEYGTTISMEWKPNDSASVDEQTAQYRKMLKLYLKARHVADPEHNAEPGE